MVFKFRSQCSRLVLIGVFFSLSAFAERHVLPQDPFLERVEKADLIVSGSLLSVKPSEAAIKELSESSSAEKFKKGEFVVKKVFKGNVSNGRVTIYFYNPGNETADFDRGMGALHLREGNDMAYILYLRKGAGKYIAANKFGIVPASVPGMPIDQKPDYKALDAWAAGKSTEEIVPLLSDREQRLLKAGQSN
jgi:hypothetical protein